MTEEEMAPLVEDQPTDTESQPPEMEQAQEAEFFNENFDPSTLDESLRPAYKQMQGAWTQKTQTLAEERKEIENESQMYKDFFASLQDPETQNEALAALGFTFDDEEEFEEPDPNSQMLSEWQQFKETQEEQQREFELSSLEQELELEIYEATSHLDLSDEERSLIFDHGLAMAPKNGEMDVAGAVKSFQAAQEKAVERYLASKRAPQAPSGRQGSEVVDLNDRDARQEQMASIMRAHAND
jgi:hypothetical protein